MLVQGISSLLLAGALLSVGGCENLGNFNLNNFNRDYEVQYDANTGRIVVGGKVSGAKPGEGRASLGASVAGTIGGEPDFKQPVEAMKGFTF